MGSTDPSALPSRPTAAPPRRRGLTPQALDALLAGATIVTHGAPAGAPPAGAKDTPAVPPGASPPALSGEWHRLRLYAGGALLALCFALFGWQVWRGRDPAPVTLQPLAPASGAEIWVQVAGEVAHPGVYRLAQGDRVEHAVQAAGGFTATADAGRVNLAQRVRDEQRIDVPALGGPSSGTTAGAPDGAGAARGEQGITGSSSGPPRGGAALVIPGGPGPGGASAERAAQNTAHQGQKVNVNTASAAELEELPGIGEVTARRIVEYRSTNGSIRSLEQLRAAGISDTLLRRAAERLAFE